ncbi:MAG: hypothetical protein JNK53_07110, partial [Phycisphaerae bacterium]|nr:hypothetical protein [Phycisphaerae bacterium]
MTDRTAPSLDAFGIGAAPRDFGRRIARLVLHGSPPDASLQAALGDAACLALVRSEQGHAYLDFDAPVLLARLDVAMEPTPFEGHRVWGDVIAASGAVPAQPVAGELLVLDGRRLYLRRLWESERALAEWLARRAAGEPTNAPWVDALVRAAFGADSPAEQVNAVRQSVGRALSVVTGGPGTGKTFVVARILLAQGIAFALRHGRAPEVA